VAAHRDIGQDHRVSIIMSSILGGSRALFAMRRRHVVPRMFAAISGRGTPLIAVLVTGLGTLLTFLLINLSLFQLRRTMPHAPR
jgi:amino acid permease